MRELVTALYASLYESVVVVRACSDPSDKRRRVPWESRGIPSRQLVRIQQAFSLILSSLIIMSAPHQSDSPAAAHISVIPDGTHTVRPCFPPLSPLPGPLGRRDPLHPLPISPTLTTRESDLSLTPTFLALPPMQTIATSHQSQTPAVQLEPIEAAKRLAAYAAVDNHIRPEHKVRRLALDPRRARR